MSMFRRRATVLVLALTVGMTTAVSAVGVASATQVPPGASTTQGITPTSVTVGSISTQSGPISSNFSGLIYGEKAYFNYINAAGGVNGRKINLKYVEDDAGDPSTFNQLATTLINQDKVFAITGVSTAFFSPSVFAESGIPTYGYNVTGNWNGPLNLFAAGGSVLCYKCGQPAWSYLYKTTKATKIGIVSYNVAASSAGCTLTGSNFKKAGFDVAYEDNAVAYPGSTVATDVQRMKQAGVNFILSCMDVTGNISMARAVKQYGLQTKQLWLNGNDQSTLNQYSNLMQGIYFNIPNVPFDAPQSTYPGLKLYLTQMKKYEPAYTYSGLAQDGWQSAALFAQGLQAAGKNPTWGSVIADTNKITSFTSNGLIAPVNWSEAHTSYSFPNCSAFIQVKGKKYVTALNRGRQVFSCFGPSIKNPTVVKSLPGTPGTAGTTTAATNPPL